MQRQLALVTGASSGIGREMSKVLAAKGYNLVLVGRDAGRLADVARMAGEQRDIEATTISADLAESGAATAIMVEIERRGLGVDILEPVMHYQP